MKTVREMFVSLTTMLINHIWASIIEICVEKWRTQSLKKLKFKCPDMRNGIDLRRCPHLPHICPFWVGTNMSYNRAPLPLPSTDRGGDKIISVQRDGALVLANKLGQTSTKYLGGYRVLRLWPPFPTTLGDRFEIVRSFC